MALTSEQRRVLNAIKRIGRRRGASPKEMKAAVATGLVESNLRNLGYGDRDSQGWRQERKQFYKDPTNLTASINRFFDETSKVRTKYGSAGQLAQAVQRSAFPERYDQQGARAEALLGLKGGGSGGGSRSVQLQDVEIGREDAFDAAGFEDAKRKYLVGRLIAKRNPRSFLIRSGLLGTEAPSEDDFTSPKLTSKIVKGDKLTLPGEKGGSSAAAGRPRSKLLEMFHDPGINFDSGKRTGAIGGHGSHVHVAFASPTDRQRAVKLAKDMGLTITSEGGGKHAAGSFHYQSFQNGKSKAIDVGGPANVLRRYNRRIAKMYGV